MFPDKIPIGHYFLNVFDTAEGHKERHTYPGRKEKEREDFACLVTTVHGITGVYPLPPGVYQAIMDYR